MNFLFDVLTGPLVGAAVIAVGGRLPPVCADECLYLYPLATHVKVL